MAIDTRPLADPQIVFPGASVMAAVCRTFEWEKTALGPLSEWSPALRVAVAIVLESPFPMNLWSGPDLNLIYNDAYRALLGAKHPHALGRPGSEVWGEIWPQLAGMFDQIRAGGAAIYVSVVYPAVKGADYTVTTILAEAFPTEVQDLYKKYADAFGTPSGNLLNLTLLSDLGK